MTIQLCNKKLLPELYCSANFKKKDAEYIKREQWENRAFGRYFPRNLDTPKRMTVQQLETEGVKHETWRVVTVYTAAPGLSYSQISSILGINFMFTQELSSHQCSKAFIFLLGPVAGSLCQIKGLETCQVAKSFV